jgi:hypothetical protein
LVWMRPPMSCRQALTERCWRAGTFTHSPLARTPQTSASPEADCHPDRRAGEGPLAGTRRRNAARTSDQTAPDALERGIEFGVALARSRGVKNRSRTGPT